MLAPNLNWLGVFAFCTFLSKGVQNMNNSTYYADDWISRKSNELEDAKIPAFEAGLLLGWLGGILSLSLIVTVFKLLM